jgi:chromosome segregation ATPase
LFTAEVKCEKLSLNESQYESLKVALAEREAELSALKLSLNEGSILESETVVNLQNDMNALKSMLFTREEELKTVLAQLQNRETALHDNQIELEHLKAATVPLHEYESLTVKFEEKALKIEQLEKSYEESMAMKDAVLQESRNNVTILNSALENEEKKVLEKEGAIKSIQEQLDKSQTDKLRLEGYYEELQTSSEVEISQLNSKCEELNASVQELMQENDHINDTSKNSLMLEKVVNDLQQDANHQQFELNETSIQLANLLLLFLASNYFLMYR